jgi:CubicO group peptidase (beta-lactamase class C family)
MAVRLVKHGSWLLAAVAAVGVAAAAIQSGEAETAPALTVNERPAAPVSVPPPPAPPFSPDLVNDAAGQLQRLHSLLMSRRGEVVFERYYNGARAERPANIKSASKRVISALVGIAIARGLIADADTPIVKFFPELAQDPDRRKRDITVEHLLTMRPGLEGTSNRNYGAWVSSRNWVRHALARPMFAPPGDEMEYSTGNTHLLSAILTKISGRSTLQFANEALARPLGFTLPPWPRDPQGVYFGGNDMLMTPRQMLAFGELYLNRGRSSGASPAQVVPEDWVARSCEGRTRNRRPGSPGFGPTGWVDPMRDRKYGYGWWVHEIRGYETCFAWGYGGQYVFVFPDLELVVVTTSSPDVSEERRGHRQLLFDLLDRLVIAPMMSGTAQTRSSRVLGGCDPSSRRDTEGEAPVSPSETSDRAPRAA